MSCRPTVEPQLRARWMFFFLFGMLALSGCVSSSKPQPTHPFNSESNDPNNVRKLTDGTKAESTELEDHRPVVSLLPLDTEVDGSAAESAYAGQIQAASHFLELSEETLSQERRKSVVRAVSPSDSPDLLPLPEFQPTTMPFEGSYQIQPGDELEIKIRSTPLLNETVTVRPDGVISLPIAGEVPAAFLTPAVLGAELEKAYAGTIKAPQVVVIVRNFSGNHVFVGGEVLLPGEVPISSSLTSLQAIIKAGGFKDTANRKEVIVRRGGVCVWRLNLRDAVIDQGLRDMQLQPNDIVFVRKSKIARMNQFVDQYIERMLPFDRSFGVFLSRASGAGIIAP